MSTVVSLMDTDVHCSLSDGHWSVGEIVAYSGVVVWLVRVAGKTNWHSVTIVTVTRLLQRVKLTD
jgi:hypothetical protein